MIASILKGQDIESNYGTLDLAWNFLHVIDTQLKKDKL